MILLIVSCSPEEIIEDCGCVESQEIKVERRVWTGGDWMEVERWEKTNKWNNIQGCFTDEETQYMVRYVNDYQRWILNCYKN